jgi:hypothetical protein
MSERTDEHRRTIQRKWGIFRVSLGFVGGFATSYYDTHHLLTAFFVGLFIGLIMLFAHWRWSSGYNVGVFSGDKDGPTAEEEFDEAIRKMKEDEK